MLTHNRTKIIFLLIFAFLGLRGEAQAVPFSVEFNYSGPFFVFGHLPIPQVNGFDYAITNENLEGGLAGQTITINQISLTADVTNLGDRINFDVEIHLSGQGIGLPPGQQFNTLVDPV